MYTTKNLDIGSQGQKQNATPNTSGYELRSRNSTKTSSFRYSLPINERIREPQFDIIEEQGKKLGTRMTTRDNNTEVNDQEQKDILDSDSSDCTNLPSFRCILNEEDPDLNNPNLYNCKTCRKGLINIRSRQIFQGSIASNAIEDNCEEHSFKRDQLSGDLETNLYDHERYHLRTLGTSSASNTVQTISSVVKQLPINNTSVVVDDHHKSNVYHLQVCLPKISFEESKNEQADESESRWVSSALEEVFKNQSSGKRRTITYRTKIKAKGPLKCKQCPKHFSTKRNLESHTLVHGAQPKFTCEFCQKGFMCISNFESHSRIHKTDIEVKCPFKCNKCSKRFTSKSNFQRHMLAHSAQAKFICDFCSKAFTAKWNLIVHLNVHEIDVDVKFPFKCDKCPKRYGTKQNMKRHMLVHGAQANFVCDFCSKGYMVKWLLRNHLKVHEKNVDVKFPFKCDKCSRRFTSKGNCESHMLVHGAQAKFICDFCSKGFMIKWYLKRHIGNCKYVSAK